MTGEVHEIATRRAVRQLITVPDSPDLSIKILGPARIESPLAALLDARQTTEHYVDEGDRVLLDDPLAAMSGCTEMVVGRWRRRFVHIPMALAVSKRNQVDPHGRFWKRPGSHRDSVHDGAAGNRPMSTRTQPSASFRAQSVHTRPEGVRSGERRRYQRA